MPVAREKLTNKQKALLQPFAEGLFELLKPLKNMSEKELKSIIQAAESVTMTNCWCSTFDVAPLVSEAARRNLMFSAGRSKLSEERK